MNFLLLPFLVLSAIGFVLSAAAHVVALTGTVPLGSGIVMLLHIGIFVVWFPTVLVANRVTKGANRKDFWKIALSGCPPWMRYAMYGLFFYAALNFVIFISSTTHGPHSKAITAETIRGFSGHWMAFYAAAFATLYSTIRRPQMLQDRTCPNGHTVSLSDAYCPICGRVLESLHGTR
jgi:hypothetical protein